MQQETQQRQQETPLKIEVSEPDQTPMTQQQLERFVAKPWIAVLSWVSPKGEVASTPVWYEYTGNRFWLHTSSVSFKLRSVERNPSVSLCIQDPAPPYRCVTIRAKAHIIEDAEGGFELDKRLARRYLGGQGAKFYIEKVYPTFPGESRIVELKPTKITSFDGNAGVHPALIVVMRAARKVGL